MRDVSNIDTRSSALGHDISFPVCIAPSAMNRMAHPEGEVAVARGIQIIYNIIIINICPTISPLLIVHSLWKYSY